MDRDFYTDEFEDLIREKADQYRMYPSDKVWKGIKRSLHSNKRKYWFGFALLLTGLSYYGIDQMIFSTPVKQLSEPVPNVPPVQKQPGKVVPFSQVIPGTLNRKQPDVPLVNSDLPENTIDLQGDVAVNPFIPAEPTATIKSGNPDLSNTERRAIPQPADLSLERITPNQISVINIEKNLSNFFDISAIQSGKQLDDLKDEDVQQVNWLQEYAVYDLVPGAPKRINWQLSFAPTMSYRKLTGTKNANISSNSRNIPIALNIEGDVDKLVNHKPALGFELGSYVLYTVNHNLSLKAGLQFNYSRYDIQAYSSATERATISLNSINGLSSSSISNYTQIRNFGGYAVQNLQNQYFQLSVPLGIELNILGNNKIQLGVAGSIQPTYLLNPDTYLISSDYKNYTKEPSLVRRWNVNTSAETFVSYKTAGLRWQVGPQIRYQLLSSYTNKYPIKEYLIEYGVKIGVTKTIR